MKSTDELKKEHRGIELMLKVMTAVAEKADRNEALDTADLDAMVEFLTIFADKCHHGKEEEFLFPALEEAGVKREGGPIGVMLAEHAQGRALIAKIREAVTTIKAGDQTASKRFAGAAGEYAALLAAHIYKEDNVLFPMADARLSAAKDDWLIENFERLESERIGPGKHEEFHALLKRLKAKYLEA
jgi:hemerythrin-like domain-containing protein